MLTSCISADKFEPVFSSIKREKGFQSKNNKAKTEYNEDKEHRFLFSKLFIFVGTLTFSRSFRNI